MINEERITNEERNTEIYEDAYTEAYPVCPVIRRIAEELKKRNKEKVEEARREEAAKGTTFIITKEDVLRCLIENMYSKIKKNIEDVVNRNVFSGRIAGDYVIKGSISIEMFRQLLEKQYQISIYPFEKYIEPSKEYYPGYSFNFIKFEEKQQLISGYHYCRYVLTPVGKIFEEKIVEMAKTD